MNSKRELRANISILRSGNKWLIPLTRILCLFKEMFVIFSKDNQNKSISKFRMETPIKDLIDANLPSPCLANDSKGNFMTVSLDKISLCIEIENGRDQRNF